MQKEQITQSTSLDIEFIKTKFKEWNEKGYITRELKNEAAKSTDVPLAFSGICTYLKGDIKNINKATKLLVWMDAYITNIKKSLFSIQN